MHRPISLTEGALNVLSKDSKNSAGQDKRQSFRKDPPDQPDVRELKREIKKVANLRDTLYGKRLRLKDKRHELRQEREVLSELDTQFMLQNRRSLEQSDATSQNSLITSLEAQRNVIGSLQYDYDQAENEHDVLENQLDTKETKLMVLLSSLISKESDDEEDTSSSISNEHHDLIEEGLDFAVHDEAQMRLAEYQSRIGDAMIMYERLQDLVFERERRLSFASNREEFAPNLDVDEEWTDDLDYRCIETAHELNVIKQDVQRLKEALQLDGYWKPEYDPPSGIGSPFVISTSPHLDPRQASPRKRSISDSAIPMLHKKFSIAQARINWWIFLTFGNSPLEHVRHKEMLPTALDDRTWARLVFQFWHQDGLVDDVGDDFSNGSWEMVFPHKAPEHKAHQKYVRMAMSVLLSGLSEAYDAISAFNQIFPYPVAPKNHATPYPARVLESDMLSQYESRSN